MSKFPPEGHVAITFALPQEIVQQLDVRIAEEQLRVLREGQSNVRITRTSWIRSVVEKHLEKLLKK